MDKIIEALQTLMAEGGFSCYKPYRTTLVQTPS